MSEDRDWATIGGLLVVGASAAITSFSAQANLAHLAGWPDWMSWLLPATDDVYGVAATRIWLSDASSPELKKHARAHAFSALVLSMAGNAIDHAVKSKALDLGSDLWILVVAVSLVPPIALGALMHLVTLRGRGQDAAEPVTEPAVPTVERATEPRTVPSPARATEPLTAGTVTPNRAIAAPEPSHRATPTEPVRQAATEPTEPTAAPVTEPAEAGTVEPSHTDRANHANTESGSDGLVPPELRPGVKAPDYVIAKAREIYAANTRLTDRKLAIATRDHYGVPYAVIGRSACQTVIADYERGEATG